LVPQVPTPMELNKVALKDSVGKKNPKTTKKHQKTQEARVASVQSEETKRETKPQEMARPKANVKGTGRNCVGPRIGAG